MSAMPEWMLLPDWWVLFCALIGSSASTLLALVRMVKNAADGWRVIGGAISACGYLAIACNLWRMMS